MKERSHCNHCGQEFPEQDLLLFDGAHLCPSCLGSQTVLCHDCEERIWREDNAGTEDHPLCQHCYDQDYTFCVRCGALIRFSSACYLSSDDDEENPYCDACHYALSREEIRDYYFKPEPIFYGSGPRFFGVELEIDGGGETNHKAARLLSIANGNGLTHLYCKHDGSLDDGFELVTHPMTLAYHQEEMPWKSILAEAVKMGYQSHRAGTCGLHIHISREAFGNTEEDQEEVIARILYFFEKHWEELLKFSRRSQRQLDRWANRYGYKDQPMDILDHAKKGSHAGRYTCVNLLNSDTIEFRIFRGTLKYNTFIATLQLVDRICDVALFLSDEELKAMSWTTFVSGCTQPELVQYLKERRLYINEPITGEEEV